MALRHSSRVPRQRARDDTVTPLTEVSNTTVFQPPPSQTSARRSTVFAPPIIIESTEKLLDPTPSQAVLPATPNLPSQILTSRAQAVVPVRPSTPPTMNYSRQRTRSGAQPVMRGSPMDPGSSPEQASVPDTPSPGPTQRLLDQLPLDDSLMDDMISHLETITGRTFQKPLRISGLNTAEPTMKLTLAPEDLLATEHAGPAGCDMTNAHVDSTNGMGIVSLLSNPIMTSQSATVFLGLQKPGYVSSSVISELKLRAPVNVISVWNALLQLQRFPARILNKLPINNAIWVATSLQPINIESGRHQNHSTHFTEIGSLAQVLNEGLHAHSGILQPAEHSEARSAVINAHNLPPDERIYVLYVYPAEDMEVSPDSSTSTSRPTNNSAPVLTGNPASTNAITPNHSTAYLIRHFSNHRKQLEALLALSYGTAYKHALLERSIRVVVDEIGMKWPAEGITSSVSPERGVTVTLAEVVEFMHHGTAGTFKNIHGRMTKSRAALDLLKRLEQTGRLDAEDKEQFVILKAFILGDIIRDPGGIAEDSKWTDGEYVAATMKIAALESMLKHIFQKHPRAV